ncbi:Protein FAM91A1 [Galemys pyrenaicus]|uniref:Protein FAM91A1 n=1 Tax=Galemys pyrenaicus TaxID=202257 RepID=A0A8J6AE37_GALPY|nr:Protein FAM91A1 [Galemys pyrenaicus]
MMGNLSPFFYLCLLQNLKSHAVTMFEVGKLSDESLDSFLVELEKVQSTGEGEAQRYFDHALTLRNTILFLRHNKDLVAQTAYPDQPNYGFPLDLLRCESLLGLDPATCSRVLNKNYTLLVSMAPLTNEIRPVSSCTPQVKVHPETPRAVIFFLLTWLAGGGYDRLLITSWGHDPGVVPTSNVLTMLNDALTHSAVLIQGHGLHGVGETVHIPFPFDETELQGEFTRVNMGVHKALQVLRKKVDLQHFCGYVTMLNASSQLANRKLSDASDERGWPRIVFFELR